MQLSIKSRYFQDMLILVGQGYCLIHNVPQHAGANRRVGISITTNVVQTEAISSSPCHDLL